MLECFRPLVRIESREVDLELGLVFVLGVTHLIDYSRFIVEQIVHANPFAEDLAIPVA